jgi:hypothetical protein
MTMTMYNKPPTRNGTLDGPTNLGLLAGDRKTEGSYVYIEGNWWRDVLRVCL